MKSRQAFATLMAAMLVLGVLVAAGNASPFLLKHALAQTPGVTIRTSADSHDGVFFGGALQVVIDDPNKSDSNTVENIQVQVQGMNSHGSDTKTFTISETSTSSHKFEFYLANKASGITVNTLSPMNTAGVCLTNGTTCSTPHGNTPATL